MVRAYLILLSVSLSLASIPVGTPARGQAVEEGATSLERAIEAYESGRLAEARRLFARAHEEAPSARTLRGLGVVSFMLGDYVEAIAQLDASLVHPVLPLTDELRSLVFRLAEDARARVGALTLAGLADGDAVLLDGVPAFTNGSTVVYGMPGEHTLIVRRASAEHLNRVVRLDAGITTTVQVPASDVSAHVEDAPVEEEAAPNAAVVAIADSEQQPIRPRRRALGIPMLAAGTGTLVLGFALYATALSRRGDVERACDRVCTRAEIDARFEARRIEPIGRSGVALASLGAVTTILGGVLHRRSRRDARRQDTVTVGARSVLWSGSF